MKLANALTFTVVLIFCSSAPQSRAQCDQSCDNQNTAFGSLALPNDPGPFGFDTAFGDQALLHATGGGNTAVGTFAGVHIVAGSDNTAIGNSVMGLLIDSDGGASFNTGIGSEALGGTVGNYNTAVGYEALEVNDHGDHNTATGAKALGSKFRWELQHGRWFPGALL